MAISRQQPFFDFGPAETAPWWGLAACQDHPNAEWWFADGAKDAVAQELARRVCDTCPVRLKCLTYATEHPELEGIWGGLTARERQGRTNVPARTRFPLGQRFCRKGHDLAVYGRIHRGEKVRCHTCERDGKAVLRARRRGDEAA